MRAFIILLVFSVAFLVIKNVVQFKTPFSDSPQAEEELVMETPAAPQRKAPDRSKSPEERIVTVNMILDQIPSTDLVYYIQNFEYAMDHVKPDTVFKWETAASSGTFEAAKAVLGDNTICRNFREMVLVKGEHGVSSEGMACKRVGRSGWCRLKRGDFKSCAMEPPDNSVELLGRDVSESLERGKHRTDGFFYRWMPWVK